RLQAGDAAAFLIDADPERQLARQRPRLARHLHHLLRLGDVALEEDHATQVERFCHPPHVVGHRVAVKADNRELPDLPSDVPERHSTKMILHGLCIISTCESKLPRRRGSTWRAVPWTSGRSISFMMA